MSAIERLRENGIDFDFAKLEDIAKRYAVVELSLFGSSLRHDMPADSDVDILVAFSTKAEVSLFDVMDFELELERLFGRSVDLVEREALTNPIRRQNILSTIERLYAA